MASKSTVAKDEASKAEEKVSKAEEKVSKGGSWCCLFVGASSNPNSLQSAQAPAPKQASTPAPTLQSNPLQSAQVPNPLQPAPTPTPAPSKQKYHCFLTHNWGNRQANGSYDNHERVRRIYEGLQSKGVSCWFDSERMTGTIQEQMSKGIDDSDCVVGILLYFYFYYYYNSHNHDITTTSIYN